MYTYEINNESFTFCDDLIAHVKEQKKNFMHATPFTLIKAVKVFGENRLSVGFEEVVKGYGCFLI